MVLVGRRRVWSWRHQTGGTVHGVDCRRPVELRSGGDARGDRGQVEAAHPLAPPTGAGALQRSSPADPPGDREDAHPAASRAGARRAGRPDRLRAGSPEGRVCDERARQDGLKLEGQVDLQRVVAMAPVLAEQRGDTLDPLVEVLAWTYSLAAVRARLASDWK